METQQYPHKIKREEKPTKQESITTTRSSSSSSGSSNSSSSSSSSSNSSSTKQQLATINSSPPSASSSPTHEFSFTISVHPPSATTVPDKTKAATGTPPTSFAIDLSPADDIFFHGHLLPLHLLSHLPISPRSSTNSLDNFSLPIKNTTLDDSNNKPSSNSTSINNNIVDNNITSNTNVHNTSHRRSTKSAKYAFPLFGLARWRKACEVVQKENKEEDETKPKRKKKKVRLNVAHILRRYIRLVRPLLVFRRKDHRPLRRQPYSFSGNLMWKGKQELKGRREHSAPASMWTSPTNSGLLVATATLHTAKSDSTMEELQSAIQAAIAHCKNSIAVKEEKLKC